MTTVTPIEQGGREAPPNAITLSAATWLAGQNPPPEHVVPELRARFELSAKEACHACELASRLRSVREPLA